MQVYTGLYRDLRGYIRRDRWIQGIQREKRFIQVYKGYNQGNRGIQVYTGIQGYTGYKG